MNKLHAHVAQSAETDHANFLAPGDAPAAHGRVGCDPSAEERRGSGEIEVGGDAQDEAFVDDDAVGVATIGDASEVLVRGVEGEGHVRAELLKAPPALGAGAVRVDQATDRGEVAGLELGDRGADLGDPADDLMAGDAGIDSGHEAAPLVPDLVEIGVADSAEEDVDLYVVCGGIAPGDRGAGQRRGRTGSGVRFRLVHGSLLLSLSFWARNQARYCSSLTCSIQSAVLPSSCSTMAMCVMAAVAVAPCQCFSPGGNQITSPGRISSIGPPQRCASPQPAVTIRVWPSGCVCH